MDKNKLQELRKYFFNEWEEFIIIDCKKTDRAGVDNYFTWENKWIEYLEYLEFKNEITEDEYLDFSRAGNGLDFEKIYQEYKNKTR